MEDPDVVAHVDHIFVTADQLARGLAEAKDAADGKEPDDALRFLRKRRQVFARISECAVFDRAEPGAALAQVDGLIEELRKATHGLKQGVPRGSSGDRP